MNPFSGAIDVIFEDPNMGRDAVYTPVATGVAVDIRVMQRRPDEIVGIGGSRIKANVAQFDLRASEVVAPAAGDKITFEDGVFIVKSWIHQDGDRLIWTIDSYPEE